MSKHPVLVGIVPRKNLWDVIRSEKWYHIPAESAPKNANLVKYVAFYFPRVFGEELKYRVWYYAKVEKVDIVKRIELFPKERGHKRANEDYLRFRLEQIEKLPNPIPSKRWRRIVHIPTTYQKLFTAKEINDLYDTSPIEEDMYREMKMHKIEAERQLYVSADEKNFCLDFAIFCKQGNIDVECDGERYHILPDALARDRERNNLLTSFGWRVLRFSGREIKRGIQSCLNVIERTIDNLGKQSVLVPDEFR